MGDPNPKPREPLTGRTWRQQLPGFRSAVFFAGASAFVFLGFGLTLAALTTRVTFVAAYTVTLRQPSPQGLDLAFVIVCKQPAMWTRVSACKTVKPALCPRARLWSACAKGRLSRMLVCFPSSHKQCQAD